MSVSTSPQAVWDGEALREAFTFAASLLLHHREHINALNVFPVPDGDTGTNMSLTMTGALEAVEELDKDAGAVDVAAKLAYGALMSARGNSGVILSQIFRGFASGLGSGEQIDGRDIARALEGSRDTAYKAVMRPVEGTMLTVIKAAATGAISASSKRAAVQDALSSAHAAASTALEKTPEQLDILRQAGVVDAGGQGVVYLLEALMRSANGQTDLLDAVEHDRYDGDMTFLDMVDDTHGEDAFGYCTNFMIFGTDIDVERCRDDIAAMGQSAVIVGDESMLKVHIHSLNPGEILEYAVRLGEIDQIKIDNMTKQTEALAANRNPKPSILSKSAQGDSQVDLHGSLAIIAVAAGKGISNALRSLGVTKVISGGQSMNPSTQELLAAAESCDGSEVIVLPNNKNIVMAANQVDALTSKTVRVVPSRSIPAGLAALSAFNTDQRLDWNLEHMTSAMDSVAAISITRAVRNVELSGVNVSEGQSIGLVNDRLVASGDSEPDTVIETLSAAEIDDPELITVFVGEQVASADSGDVHARLSERWPDAEIEMHDGGQPHYRYIISAE